LAMITSFSSPCMNDMIDSRPEVFKH
jgi:hypothetical protein